MTQQNVAAEFGSETFWDGRFGLPGVDENVDVVLVDGRDVYVAGSFWTAGGIVAHRIARWDTATSTWHHFSQSLYHDSLEREAQALAVVGEELYAGGALGLRRWNETTQRWEHPGEQWVYDGEVHALAVIGTDLYVGGRFDDDKHRPHSALLRWDTVSGTATNPGTFEGAGGGIGTVYALAVHGTHLYVGGAFAAVAGDEAINIARYDSATETWAPLGSGVSYAAPSGYRTPWVRHPTVDASGFVYAAGNFDRAGAVTVNGLARWDPAGGWVSFGDELACGRPAYCSGRDIHALTAYRDEVYVGGEFDTVAGKSSNSIARWNGTQWTVLETGVSWEWGGASHRGRPGDPSLADLLASSLQPQGCRPRQLCPARHLA